MPKHPASRRDNGKEKRGVEPTIIVAIIGLIGTVAAAILASPVLIALIEKESLPPPISTKTNTPVPSTATPKPDYVTSTVVVKPFPPISVTHISYDVASASQLQEINHASVIKLRQFELYKPATSFTESGDAVRKTYELDDALIWDIYTDGCAGDALSSISRIREALKHYAQQKGRIELLSYIETNEQVINLARDHPDIANELIPQSYEWQDLGASDNEAYSLWLTQCIGVPYPAFLVTIENLSDQEQLITKIIYHTEELSEIRGGAGGALSPEITYIHEISYMLGNQEASLEPSFRIPPRSNGSFILELITEDPGCGLVWLMRIYFVIDEDRGGVNTDEFELIMSGPGCG